MSLPKKRFLTPEQAAAELEVTAKTLENWRAKEIGPPYRRHGARIRYLLDDIHRWDHSTRVGSIPGEDR